MTSEKTRILIIDDDEVHLETTKGILEEEGYEVHVQNRPLGSTNRIRDLQPHLVLLDVNMPGLSGTTLSTIIRSNPATMKVPLYLYSSNDEDLLRKAVKENNLSGYVCKGSPSELRAKVARAVASRSYS
ncbi:MAG TPA: response regulator [Thermoanaerobaculia bacterium]|nr:response regulator [Thermoanaerobaculia bacterium]